MASEVAVRYAEGLFALARENGTVREKKDQCDILLKLYELNPELTGFFRAAKVSDEEKKNFVETVFGAVTDTDMRNYIKLLIDKARESILRESLNEFVRMADEELGIQPATVWSARKLPEAEMAQLQKALEEKTGKQIHLTNRINPELLAGIKVTVGNNVTDMTMRSRIDHLKETLLKGGGQA